MNARDFLKGGNVKKIKLNYVQGAVDSVSVICTNETRLHTTDLSERIEYPITKRLSDELGELLRVWQRELDICDEQMDAWGDSIEISGITIGTEKSVITARLTLDKNVVSINTPTIELETDEVIAALYAYIDEMLETLPVQEVLI